MSSFICRGNAYFPYEPAIPTPLPVGTYKVQFAPESGYYLDPCADMPTPARVYGKNHADRILSTYTTLARPLGVWLSGDKGSGKTMLAGVLSSKLREQGICSLLVERPYSGPSFSAFLQNLPPSLILFDEFEKVYHESDEQSSLLSVFSGTGRTNHMYVLTTNDEYKVHNAMRNRPSRMRYFIDYNGISEDTAADYLADKLQNMSRYTEVLSVLRMIPHCNFDIMQTIVEELNLYGGAVAATVDLLNITRQVKANWKVTFTGIARKEIDGEYDTFPVDLTTYDQVDPLSPAGVSYIRFNAEYAGKTYNVCVQLRPDQKKTINSAGDIVVSVNDSDQDDGYTGTLTFSYSDGLSNARKAF